MSVHFSSETCEWSTPQWLFDGLHQQWKFTLDVCASAENAKCERFFTKEDDGLAQEWTGVCWMNPPYGREIGRWVRKARESAERGATVVCLLPARTDTAWWHEYVAALPSSFCGALYARSERSFEIGIGGRVGIRIAFLRGRLKFGNAKASAPFPSAIVIFDGGAR